MQHSRGGAADDNPRFRATVLLLLRDVQAGLLRRLQRRTGANDNVSALGRHDLQSVRRVQDDGLVLARGAWQFCPVKGLGQNQRPISVKTAGSETSSNSLRFSCVSLLLVRRHGDSERFVYITSRSL